MLRMLIEDLRRELCDWTTNDKSVVISGKTAEVLQDVTDYALGDVPSVSRGSRVSGVVKVFKMKLPKAKGKLENQVLQRLRNERPVDLGYYSHGLVYAPKYWKAGEHAALIKLLRRGDLRVVEIADPDNAYGFRDSVSFRRRLIVGPWHLK